MLLQRLVSFVITSVSVCGHAQWKLHSLFFRTPRQGLLSWVTTSASLMYSGIWIQSAGLQTCKELLVFLVHTLFLTTKIFIVLWWVEFPPYFFTAKVYADACKKLLAQGHEQKSLSLSLTLSHLALMHKSNSLSFSPSLNCSSAHF